MTPVSVRTESEKWDLGNQVSAMVVSLATNVGDPVERLGAVQRSTATSKEVTEAVGCPQPAELSQLGAGTLIGVGTRLPGRSPGRVAQRSTPSSPTCLVHRSRCTSQGPSCR